MKCRHVLICSALALVLPIAVAQDTSAQAPPKDCGVWSIHGVRIGMPIEELKAAKRKVRKTGDALPGEIGKRIEKFSVSEKGSLDEVDILASVEEPRRVLFATLFVLKADDPQALVDELSSRWGAPTSNRAVTGTARFGNAFRDLGEFPRRLTTWSSSECHVTAMLEETPVASGRTVRTRVFLTISDTETLIAVKAAVAHEDDASSKKQAHEAVRP